MRFLPAALLVAVALLAGPARPAPVPELVREEAHNFKILGELPRGWERRPDTLVWSWAVDGIPHAYVHLARERLEGDPDVDAQLRKRAHHYRFPGAPEGSPESVGPVDWSGRPALQYLHEATVQGVLCRRRVTALYAGSIWYELIETVYGERTEEIDACGRGLRVFRRGFRLLVEPLPEELRLDNEERVVVDDELGFRIRKPKGFLRTEIDPGEDPGCRVAFQAQAGDPRKSARVRLFEYGTRETLDLPQWMDIFYTNFAGIHLKPRREAAPAPVLHGARLAAAERFHGEREGLAISTYLLLVHAGSGRVFALRIRTAHGAGEEFREAIEGILASLALE